MNLIYISHQTTWRLSSVIQKHFKIALCTNCALQINLLCLIPSSSYWFFFCFLQNNHRFWKSWSGSKRVQRRTRTDLGLTVELNSSHTTNFRMKLSFPFLNGVINRRDNSSMPMVCKSFFFIWSRSLYVLLSEGTIGPCSWLSELTFTALSPLFHCSYHWLGFICVNIYYFFL